MTQIIAEISANHLGSRARAIALVHAAKLAGADAVKLQTWAPDKMVLDPELVLADGPWQGRRMQQLYREALLPWDAQKVVFEVAKSLGIECFASVFDLESLAFLESLGCPRYKIASCELVDLPLIGAVARTGKPIILSSGMATHTEIERGILAARQGGATDITLLKCTSAYPASETDANLRTMEYYVHRFLVAAGVSDHTRGVAVATVAAALGASMIEKHFTLARANGGLDAEFSIEPDELAHLVSLVREIPAILGNDHDFAPKQAEFSTRSLRRSLYFARDLPAGAIVQPGDIRTARPANGISPTFTEAVEGEKLRAPVKAGQPVIWGSFILPAQERKA